MPSAARGGDGNRAVSNSGARSAENSCSAAAKCAGWAGAPAVEIPGPNRVPGGGAAARKIKLGLIEAPEHPRLGYRLLCCALWIDDGAIPKYLRNTRLKCDELEKPHENATSVMVLPPWASSS